MTYKKARHIINGHYKKIERHLKKCKRDPEDESIHQFRVEYKKLRAFITLLCPNKSNAGPKMISGMLKKVYHLAGSMRDLQLQQQRITAVIGKEACHLDNYLDEIKTGIGKNRNELREIILKKPVKKSRKMTNRSLPHHFDHGIFNHYFLGITWKVRAIISYPYISDENLHAIRKHLKDLFYNLEKFISYTRGLLFDDADLRYLNVLLESFGKFQDMCSAITLLNAIPANHFNDQTFAALQTIKCQWIKEKEIMKNSLILKLSEAPFLKLMLHQK